ncbi:hypothetical protein AA0472_1082 [Acetobacter estunensis NRIC 0472]|nr:hypothetical protein AA0472_1082 [Acetobacter estunensis NRIC 0472]
MGAGHLLDDLHQFTLDLPQRNLSRFLNDAVAITELPLRVHYLGLEIALLRLDLIGGHALGIGLQLLLLLTPTRLRVLRITRQFVTAATQFALDLLARKGLTHHVTHADQADDGCRRSRFFRHIGSGRNGRLRKDRRRTPVTFITTTLIATLVRIRLRRRRGTCRMGRPMNRRRHLMRRLGHEPPAATTRRLREGLSGYQ